MLCACEEIGESCEKCRPEETIEEALKSYEEAPEIVNLKLLFSMAVDEVETVIGHGLVEERDFDFLEPSKKALGRK